MRIAAPFTNGRRKAKVHRNRRVNLRAVQLALHEERELRRRLAKLAEKRYDWSWRVSQTLDP